MRRAGLNIVLLLCVPGCGSSPTPPAPRVAEPEQVAVPSAADRLESVFSRYRSCSFYEDRCEAKLTVSVIDENGREQVQVRTAPLRVRWNRDNLLVDAYASHLRVRPTSKRNHELIAWFDEPDTANFDSQVLVQAFQAADSARIPLDAIFADDVLRSRMSAGLAGPPPQLEWLFADQPMAKIFQPDTSLAFRPVETLDGQACARIEVQNRNERYLFWIDEQTNLIRRVELPPPPSADHGMVVRSLTLECVDATFNPDANSRWIDQPAFSQRPVSRFVPVPPPPPPPVLGRKVATERLSSKLLPNDSGSARSVKFWVIVVTPEEEGASRSLVNLLPGLVQGVGGQPGQPNPTLVALFTGQRFARRQVPDFGKQLRLLDMRTDGEIVSQLRLPPGGAAVVDANGYVVFWERQLDVNTAGTLIAAKRDAESGINVAGRIGDEYAAIVAAYQSALREAAK